MQELWGAVEGKVEEDQSRLQMHIRWPMPEAPPPHLPGYKDGV